MRDGSRLDLFGVVAIGGALGSLARYGLSEVIPRSVGEFPWATFITNIIGCGAIGVLMGYILQSNQTHRYLRPFIGVGVLGGFTTFSTYALETWQLIVENALMSAGAYVLSNIVCGLVAVQFGLLIVRLVARDNRRGE